jgi:hypothetical protein
MPQKKSCKKWGFFITLIVTANLVGFNPALAFSHQDFTRLAERVRVLEAKALGAPEKAAQNFEGLEQSVHALEVKVLSPQENTAISMCERVYAQEKLVTQAIQSKTAALKTWDKHHSVITTCLRSKPNPDGGGFAPLNDFWLDQDCVKTQAAIKEASLMAYDLVIQNTKGLFQAEQTAAKSVGAVCYLEFNPPLASPDKDFKRLLERVRVLEAKVLNAQEKAALAMCERVYAQEKLVTQAIKQKQDRVTIWNWSMGCGIHTAYFDVDCFKKERQKRDQEFAKLDLEIQTAQQELKSTQAEAKSAGAVCN